MTSYSAEVDMWLDCGEHGTIPLAQVASTFVIAASPVNLPACIARLILMIDGRQLERRVRLSAGMSGREAQISAYDEAAPF
jgi:hypothetical protein